ncbi:hypothetical protein KC349_g2697 [Hortaea werneckii]|nr:hypothetical protein KC349_g2697 [Hortaea werneckii]
MSTAKAPVKASTPAVRPQPAPVAGTNVANNAAPAPNAWQRVQPGANVVPPNPNNNSATRMADTRRPQPQQQQPATGNGNGNVNGAATTPSGSTQGARQQDQPAAAAAAAAGTVAPNANANPLKPMSQAGLATLLPVLNPALGRWVKITSGEASVGWIPKDVDCRAWDLSDSGFTQRDVRGGEHVWFQVNAGRATCKQIINGGKYGQFCLVFTEPYLACSVNAQSATSPTLRPDLCIPGQNRTSAPADRTRQYICFAQSSAWNVDIPLKGGEWMGEWMQCVAYFKNVGARDRKWELYHFDIANDQHGPWGPQTVSNLPPQQASKSQPANRGSWEEDGSGGTNANQYGITPARNGVPNGNGRPGPNNGTAAAASPADAYAFGPSTAENRRTAAATPADAYAFDPSAVGNRGPAESTPADAYAFDPSTGHSTNRQSESKDEAAFDPFNVG